MDWFVGNYPRFCYQDFHLNILFRFEKQARSLVVSTPTSLRDRRSKGKGWRGDFGRGKHEGRARKEGKGSSPSPLSSLLPRAPLPLKISSPSLPFRTPATQTAPVHIVHKEKKRFISIFFKVKAPYQLHRLFSAF